MKKLFQVLMLQEKKLGLIFLFKALLVEEKHFRKVFYMIIIANMRRLYFVLLLLVLYHDYYQKVVHPIFDFGFLLIYIRAQVQYHQKLGIRKFFAPGHTINLR